MNFSTGLRRIFFAGVALWAAVAAEAGFPSTETFLPAVGRVSGQEDAQFYTTVWATNLTSAPVSFTFDFLKQGQANTAPASFSDTLSAGETKMYENVVESRLGLSNALGAARVTSTGEILLAERIYNQEPGDDLGTTEGLFFAGVPKSFSISLGQSASIQGINQGGSENFRYNFALVETGGGSATVNVQLLDASGTLLGQKAYLLQPYEQIQPNAADLFSGVATTNARITATVTGGTGSVLLAGAQIANESQDATGFEMSFPDILGGVTSVNGLTGALTLEAGSNISITPDGSSALKISAILAQGPAGPRGATGATGPQGPPGPVNAVSTDTPNRAALRDGSGSFAMNTLTLDGNLDLPATTSTTGIVFVGGHPFLHSFGNSNTFVGSDAGNLTMTGDFNTATGTFALRSNTSGEDNTAVGEDALTSNTTGESNIAVGINALGSNTSGSSNTAVGGAALFANTTGGDNTAIGTLTLLRSTGVQNTAIGAFALDANTTGGSNTAIGVNALAGKTTGDNNIAIGNNAGINVTNDDGNIDIGNEGVTDEGQTIRIGDGQRAAFIAGIRGTTTGSSDAVAVVIDSNGQLGTVSSSRRYKEDIRDMGDASDRLLRLRPVTFRYKKAFSDGQKPIQYGLIAEEVADVFPDLVAYGRDKKPETVKYQILSPLLLNEVLKQHATIQVQSAQVAKLTALHASDQVELTSLEKELDEQRSAFAALAVKVSNMERNAAATDLARREVPAN
jgi:hypothetical protein